MLNKIFCLLFIIFINFVSNSVFAKNPKSVLIKNKEELNKINKETKFVLSDYYGVWDSFNNKKRLIFNKDLSIETNGVFLNKCKIIRIEKNNLFMNCNLFTKTREYGLVYVMFYIAYDTTILNRYDTAKLSIDFVLHKEKDCFDLNKKNNYKKCHIYPYYIQFSGNINFDSKENILIDNFK